MDPLTNPLYFVALSELFKCQEGVLLKVMHSMGKLLRLNLVVSLSQDMFVYHLYKTFQGRQVASDSQDLFVYHLYKTFQGR